MIAKNARKKVLILGLDALSPEIYHKLREHGYLRSLDHLVSKGIVGSLKIIPPYTPQIWTSITSGVNPGKHGLYGFKCPDEYGRTKRLCNSTDVKAPRIHDIASLFNLKSLVVNLPFSSWPRIPFKGYLISDWVSPVQYAYPNDLNSVYKKYLEETKREYPKNPCKILAHDIAILKTLQKTGEKILKNIYYAFIMFSFIDEIAHIDPMQLERPKIDCLIEALELFDELCDEILWNEFGDNNLIITVSDHGIGEIKYIVSLPRILYDAGLVKSKYVTLGGETKKLSFTRKIIRILQNTSIYKAFLPIGRKIIRESPTLKRLMEKHIERPIVDIATSDVIIPEISYALYINNSDKEKTAEKIVKSIMEAQEELGHNFIEFIGYGRGVLYRGPHQDTAPDLVIVPKRGYSFSSGLNVKAPPIEKLYRKKGDHHVHNLHIIRVPDDLIYAIEIAKHIQYPWDYTILSFVALGLPFPHDVDSKLVKLIGGNASYKHLKTLYNLKLKLTRIKL